MTQAVKPEKRRTILVTAVCDAIKLIAVVGFIVSTFGWAMGWWP